VASRAKRRPENVPGDLFVDTTCIDCDTCRWMAPEVFGEAGEQAVVHRQPASDEEWQRVLRALVSCPTASIGTETKHALDGIRSSLPWPIVPPAEDVTSDVFHCGYHHEASFGAASYLIVRPASMGGNVLVDSPRFAKPLVRRLEQLGGVATLFLTHQDDVADHERFRAHFGCERVLHAGDARGRLRYVERRIAGEEPVALAPDLLVVPTPGHTEGSACLLYREAFLFSGDHVAWSERLGHVYAFHSSCWHDWGVQTRSMRRLAEHRFAWILPGHGRRCHFPHERMRAEVLRAAEWMERVGAATPES
jgi:glyoxylase-like metal-dependent hydrolase (beta-lactamase superfamily II)/ferredoxin